MISYLFQAKTFRLWDAEIDVEETKHEHAKEYAQDQRPYIIGDSRREETEEEIPDPVFASVISKQS